MSLGMEDAALLGGTLVFGLAVLRVLEKLIDRAQASRNSKRRDTPQPSVAPGAVTGQHPALDTDCRDRIVETNIIVNRLAESEVRQTELLQEIVGNTGRMADQLERRR